MSDEDRAVAAEAGGEAIEETSRHGAPYRLRLVAHDPVAYSGYYNVVSNSHFWFVQHYLWGLAGAPDTGRGLRAGWEDGYAPVNRDFADAVVSELARDPDAAVFFHDYHLYLAPQLVRDRFPTALLTHFVHIPWPEPDYWGALPIDVRRAAHEGLLANDLVGFHTDRWLRNFMRGCSDIAGAECDFDSNVIHWNGREIRAVTRPISIDPVEFDELSVDAAVLAEEALIEADRPEFLVVRVDRTDPSKNIVRGFRAFGLFLERRPEFRGRVVMLALLDPSRQDLPEYADYLAAIEREAQAVNERVRKRQLVAGRPPGRRQLRAGRRRVQAVRRPAREPDLRRHEPGREGGAARERSRRRRDPVRERRRLRRARRMGARRESVRSRGSGICPPPGTDDDRERAASPCSGARSGSCASTTSRRGSRPNSSISTRSP